VATGAARATGYALYPQTAGAYLVKTIKRNEVKEYLALLSIVSFRYEMN